MRNSVQLKDEKKQLKDQVYSILETCKTEIRSLNDSEKREVEEIRGKIENINKELSELETNLGSDKTNKDNQLKNLTMEKEFRLLKAINAIASQKEMDDVAKAVFNEGALEMRKAGINYEGQLQIPMSEIRSAFTVSAEGTDFVATDVFNVEAPLRAKNVLVNAGARYITGLVGDVKFPLLNASNVTWEGETSSASDGGQGMDSVTLSPKRLTAYVDISKQFLVQDGCGAEAAIRQDIINAINTKLEATILGTASGTTTQPAGIFYGASAGTYSGMSSFTDVCNFESAVEDANVLGECAYVMSNKAKAALRGMIKGENGTGMVYENGEVDGTKAYNTSNAGSGKYIAYGDWSNLVIGQWGAIDLTVDSVTQAINGKVRLVINAFFDAKLLRNGAIVRGLLA